MELFILIFGAVILFFYFLKKESEKADRRYFDQLRFFNDTHTKNEAQKIVNDFYRDTQLTLDNVNKEINNLKGKSESINQELINMNHLVNMILGQAGMEKPKPYKFTMGKKKDNLTVEKNKKEMEDKDGKNNDDKDTE